jgi:hypothetical protein
MSLRNDKREKEGENIANPLWVYNIHRVKDLE